MRNDDNNPILKRLDTLNAARKLWAESEWRLHFLRTETGQEYEEPSDEELLQWHQEQQ